MVIHDSYAMQVFFSKLMDWLVKYEKLYIALIVIVSSINTRTEEDIKMVQEYPIEKGENRIEFVES